MLKKITMLVLAFGALAALPSVAMGAWTDKTAAVESKAEVGFTGQAKFSGGLGSIECQTTSTTTLLPGTTGEVKTFHVDGSPTEKCKTGGFLAGCQVHSVSATGLPWVAHSTGTAIDITVGEIHNSVTGGFCPVSSVTVTGGTAEITPDNAHGASSGTLSGSVTVDATGEPSVSTVSGTQNVLAPSIGTYGIT